ncbi:MAG TPA: ABC transporter substrate-binding protein [Rugosimonospora sp.]|nr:ABC transporter substrate-binding protein [Rugosimonospora sp.]
MRRREFIALLSGATAAWPLVARAQQHAKVHRLATVAPTFSIRDMIETGPLPLFNGLFKQLRQLGYVEGHNLSVDRYSGQGRIESYPELASEVVRSHPDLIFIVTGRLARYFQAVTTTIPLVVNTGNPIAFGLVTSLARPGGNLTGVVVDAGIEIEGKRLQLLREMVPSVSKVAYLAPRVHLESPYGAQVREVAQRMGLSLFGAPLESPIGEPEYRRVFAALRQHHADVLIVSDAEENFNYRQLVVELAGEIPAIYAFRAFVEVGGLMAYAVDAADLGRHAAEDIDRIFRGASPSEIPFWQPTKFELLINLKTANALGLTMPPSLLAQADEVIE